MCVIKIYVLTTLCCCESLTLLLTKIRTGGDIYRHGRLPPVVLYIHTVQYSSTGTE